MHALEPEWVASAFVHPTAPCARRTPHLGPAFTPEGPPVSGNGTFYKTEPTELVVLRGSWGSGAGQTRGTALCCAPHGPVRSQGPEDTGGDPVSNLSLSESTLHAFSSRLPFTLALCG